MCDVLALMGLSVSPALFSFQNRRVFAVARLVSGVNHWPTACWLPSIGLTTHRLTVCL